MRKLILIICTLVLSLSANAQVPAGFYDYEYAFSSDGNSAIETGRNNSFPKMKISAMNMNLGFGLGRSLMIFYPDIMGNIGVPHEDFNYVGVTNDGSMWVYIQNNPMGQCVCWVARDLSMVVILQPFIDEYQHVYTLMR